jgi:hypothetical protein
VLAVGKKMPVSVSPVGEMAGAAAVPVPLVILVMEVRVGMVAVVPFSVAIVPVVLLSVATVPAVETRFVIVPVVLFRVAIVPAVVLIVPVSSAFITLATVIRFRLFESEASPTSNVSLVAITVSAVRS